MDEKSINSRVNLLITKLGLNPNSFIIAIKQNAQTTHKIIKGVNKPSYDYLFDVISTYSHISAEWLISGKGDIDKITVKNDRSTEVLELKIKHLQEKNEILEQEKSDLENDKLSLQADKLFLIEQLKVAQKVKSK